MADHPSPVAADLNEARDLCLISDPEQLELLRDAVPGRDATTAVAVDRQRGRRGRPPGALNKRNQKFREQLLAIAPHPALALARAYSTPVETLAAQLGCSLLEAAQLGIRAAAELLPYIESKQPVDVNMTRRNDVVLIMPSGAVSAEQLDRIAEEAGEGMAEGIDWSGAEIIDVLPSLSGTPLQAVSSDEPEQSGD
jgi:hypothetical protein